MNKRTELIECSCHSDDHVFKITLDKYDDNDTELHVSFFMYMYHGFFKRAWTALKYLFGCKFDCGHWDVVIITPHDADKMIDILQQYKSSIN